MASVNSKDGTVIAYNQVGHGPVLILINGALGYRDLHGEKELASLLSKKYSVIFYDRRGRGQSTDTQPYAVEREIEDIEALITIAGGKAFLHGTSSGAALALLAAQRLGLNKVTKLSLYEPPYGAYIKDGRNEFASIKNQVNDLINTGKTGEAIIFFFESIGTPPEVVQALPKSADWKKMETIGFTLAYDFEVLGNGTVPLREAKEIDIPTLILDGEKSFDFMHQTADTLSKTISGSKRKTLKDQTHQVTTEALLPMLVDFF